MTWSAALETGIRTIDLQHEELIALINALDHALAQPEPLPALGELLPHLSAYALFHFGTEEALFVGQPALARHAENHLREHRAFAERIAAVRAAPAADQPAAAGRLNAYLCNWIVEHIQKTDREMAQLLKDATGNEGP